MCLPAALHGPGPGNPRSSSTRTRMARIEDYAVIGNQGTIALVCRDASIDWLCLPRFDSDACFAALLGERRHGFWQIAPEDKAARSTCRYRDGTLVLETVFQCATGRVRVTDCMHASNYNRVELLRVVKGLEGEVPMHMELCLRFGYGRVIPWVTRTGDGRLQAIAGPDRVWCSPPQPRCAAKISPPMPTSPSRPTRPYPSLWVSWPSALRGQHSL